MVYDLTTLADILGLISDFTVDSFLNLLHSDTRGYGYC